MYSNPCIDKLLFASVLVVCFHIAVSCPHIDAAGLTRTDRTEEAATATDGDEVAPQTRDRDAAADDTDEPVGGEVTTKVADELRKHTDDFPAPQVSERRPKESSRTVIAPGPPEQKTEAPMEQKALPTPNENIGFQETKPSEVQQQASEKAVTVTDDDRPIIAPKRATERQQRNGKRAAEAAAARRHLPQVESRQLKDAARSSDEAGAATVPTDNNDADAREPQMSLTPQRAATIALKNSLDLKVASVKIEKAQAALRQALGLDDFKLTASATYGRRGPIPTFSVPDPQTGGTRQVDMGDPEIMQQNLQLLKPLYTGEQIEHTQKLAGQRLQGERLSRIATKRTIDLSVRKATYRVLKAAQLAEVSEKRTEATAAHLERTKKLRKAGVVPEFEVVQAETALAEARRDVISARTTFQQAKAALRQLLTLDQDTRIDVSDGEQVKAPSGNRTALIRRAWKARPEIKAAEQSVKIARANLRLAADKSDLSVNLSGGLTHTKETFGSEPWSWQVALKAEKSILDGNQEKTEIAKARSQLKSAQLQVEKLKQRIALEVTQAKLAVRDANQRRKVARQSLVEARERCRIAKVRYESGVGPGTEVLDAETALTAARAERVNARYALRSAITELRSSMGVWQTDE